MSRKLQIAAMLDDLFDNGFRAAPRPGQAILLDEANNEIDTFSTVASALAAAASGETVIYGAGDWAESVTVPAGVTLQGYPRSGQARLVGDGTTASTITLNASSFLREVGAVGPTTGSNPTVQTPTSGTCLVQFCNFSGGGSSAPVLEIQGSTTLRMVATAFNGTATSAIEHGTTGTVITRDCAFTGTFSASTFDFTAAVGRCIHTNSRTFPGHSSPIGIHLQAAGDIQIAGGYFDTGCTVGLKFDTGSDGVRFAQNGGRLNGTTSGVEVVAGLNGTGTTWLVSGTEFRKERCDFASSNWNTDASKDAIFLDEGSGGDAASVRIFGSFNVGSREFPSSISVGDGDSSVVDMKAYTFDASGGTYVDVTSSVNTATDPTATWLGDDGDGIIFGFPFKPKALDVENVVALSGGSVVLRVLTGTGPDVWSDINYMSAESGGTQTYAQTIFQRANGDENCRLNINGTAYSNMVQGDPADDGNTGYYWVGVFNDGSVSTRPTVQRVKGGDSWSETKRTGTEFFGDSEKDDQVLPSIALKNVQDISGSSPANEPLDFSTNIHLTPVDNQFNNNSRTGVGMQVPFETNVDTSRVKKLEFKFAPLTGNAGNVKFQFYYGRGSGNSTLDGSNAETEITVPVQAVSGTADEERTFEVELDVSDFVGGDKLWWALWRDGGDAADTYGGNVYLTSVVGKATLFK